MQIQKIWPENNRHYLCCDESRWLPYVSSSLSLIRWAFDNGLIDDEPDYVITRQELGVKLPRFLRETDQRTVLQVVSRMGRSSLNDIAAYMEAEMSSVGRALNLLVAKNLASRTQLGVMVNGKIRARWFYETRLSELEALSCADKKQHDNKQIAEAVLAQMSSTKNSLEAYQCKYCGMWHLGRI